MVVAAFPPGASGGVRTLGLREHPDVILPARAAVAVAALPKGARVEVDAIAAL